LGLCHLSSWASFLRLRVSRSLFVSAFVLETERYDVPAITYRQFS
jgi:hypothetical protein